MAGMPFSISLLYAVMFLAAPGVARSSGKSEQSMSPVRRVVTLLENIQKKVKAEGLKAQDTHKKFMRFCASEDLENAIAAAEGKIPVIEGDIKEKIAQQEELKDDVEDHQKDRSAAQANIDQATALREKEAAESAKEIADKTSYVAALGKAIKAIEKGMKGGFLQKSVAGVVQKLSIEMDLSSESRDELSAFFSHQGDQKYEPASGNIVGILKSMKVDMEKDLADLQAQEAEKVKANEKLMGSKQKEADVATRSVQTKQTRLGDIGVEITTLKEDLENTKESLEQNKKFAADKEGNCKREKKDWAAAQKAREAEVLALSETIKMLNDDKALELFKKTLPIPSLLQLQVSEKQVKQRALRALNAKKHRDMRLDLIALVLHGNKVSFDKVLKMIDDMVKLLDKEQADDDLRKEVCLEDLDKQEDKLKEQDTQISDAEKAIADNKNKIESTQEDIDATENGIKKLDADVTDATKTRQEEHDQFIATLADNTAAKELIELAKNRLNKFYNPNLYKEAPKKELTEAERISQSISFREDGYTLFQFTARAQMHVKAHSLSNMKEPEGTAEYSDKKSEAQGVIQMLNMIITDLDKEIKAQEVAEKDAQSDYESFIEDSKVTRSADSKTLEKKAAAKADLEADLLKERALQKAKLKEAYATTGVLGDLHKDCDWLLQNFDTRKEARASEKDSLQKAKGILSGMDGLF